MNIRESLQKLNKLDEKLPKDLATAYRRSGKIPLDARSVQSIMTDYEKANYTQIDEHRALELYNNKEYEKIVILYGREIITFNKNGEKLYSPDYVCFGDEYKGKSGKNKGTNKTKKMPFTHLIKIADKLYETDEFEYGIDMDSDIMKKRQEHAYNSYVQDTGKHTYDHWFSIKNFRLNDIENLNKYKKALEELEMKWENGLIAKVNYEEQKTKLLHLIEKHKISIYHNNGKLADKKAENRNEYSKKVLQRNLERYRDLVSDLSRTKDLMPHWQSRLDTLKRYGADDSKYDHVREKIADIKYEISSLQRNLEKYEKQIQSDTVAKDITNLEKEIENNIKLINDSEVELNVLLRRDKSKNESMKEGEVKMRKKKISESTTTKVKKHMSVDEALNFLNENFKSKKKVSVLKESTISVEDENLSNKIVSIDVPDFDNHLDYNNKEVVMDDYNLIPINSLLDYDDLQLIDDTFDVTKKVVLKVIGKTPILKIRGERHYLYGIKVKVTHIPNGSSYYNDVNIGDIYIYISDGDIWHDTARPNGYFINNLYTKDIVTKYLNENFLNEKEKMQLILVNDLLDKMQLLADKTNKIDYHPSYEEMQKIMWIKNYADTIVKNIDNSQSLKNIDKIKLNL